MPARSASAPVAHLPMTWGHGAVLSAARLMFARNNTAPTLAPAHASFRASYRWAMTVGRKKCDRADPSLRHVLAVHTTPWPSQPERRAAAAGSAHYERHRTEQTTLYHLVQQHAGRFIAHTEASISGKLAARNLPFVGVGLRCVAADHIPQPGGCFGRVVAVPLSWAAICPARFCKMPQHHEPHPRTNSVTNGSEPSCRLQWPCSVASNVAPSGSTSAA